ncbi:MAG: hypothetical protein KGP35_05045 [Bacteroidetes bacterium]|nr:hypothetical protein [Bacteroidota bacterium]
MKKLSTLIAAVLISINLFAQAPQKMSYQAVIRNAQNELVVNKPVKMRISILQGSATGNAVYSELHNATTNANGLVSIEIGAGTAPTGTFSSINWGNGTYYLKTETDPNNGTNYSIEGTSQLLSVPYALQANNAGNGIKEVSKTGDTVYLDNGKKYIIPGIKDLNPPSTINNGLVGYWPFNGNANDESGNGNNGSFTGSSCIGCGNVTAAPASANDRFNSINSSYQFSNSFDLISIPNSSSLQVSDQFTISIWANPNLGEYGQGPSYLTLLQKWGGTGSGASYMVGLTPSGVPVLYTNNAITTTIFLGLNPISLNAWSLITFSYINGVANLYINGVFSNSGSNLVNPAIQDSTIEIARNLNQFPNYAGDAFTGKIDDIRIYNRALTQEEITYLANN